jgi:hypothetical protein
MFSDNHEQVSQNILRVQQRTSYARLAKLQVNVPLTSLANIPTQLVKSVLGVVDLKGDFNSSYLAKTMGVPSDFVDLIVALRMLRCENTQKKRLEIYE